jgi:hypothetical protein
MHKATAQFQSEDLTESTQNVIRFIPYSYQYVRHRCASIAAQYLDLIEIHIPQHVRKIQAGITVGYKVASCGSATPSNAANHLPSWQNVLSYKTLILN